MGKLLTIETGFSCNSRCHYCTQLDYRVLGQAEHLDLTTEQIRDRIAWGARNGYDQIGFSGGEPTIRPDFVELVAYAKSLDFEQIGVTTNGRMLAYRAFAERAMLAGLDSFTFSLHGPTAEIHDKITHAQGSLDQALQGLRNLQWIEKKHGLKARLMNNQILLPENTRYLKEIVALLAPLGIRLFMIQPFIAQRSNVQDLGKFFVPYAEVVAAVEAALPELRRWNARVKPYNVPNCLLLPFGRDVVEPQFYGITVYREFEAEGAGEFKAFKARQWFRIDACATCKEVCPGFRIEQQPQAEMSAGVVQAARMQAQELPRTTGEGPLLFSGTELLAPQTLRSTLQAVAQEHGPIGWLTAGSERATRSELAEIASDLAQDGTLAELVLIAQPMDQRFLAQRVLEKGSLEALRQLLSHLGGLREKGRPVPRLRLLVNVGDLARMLDDPEVAQQVPALARALQRAAGDQPVDALLAVPNFPRGQTPPDMARQADENRQLARRLADGCLALGLQPRLVTLDDRRGLDPLRAQAMALAEAHFAEVLPVEPWTRRLFRHPLSMPEMDFVSWSPPWLFERWDLTRQPLPEGALPKRPLREAGLGVRTQAVARLSLGQAAGLGRWGRPKA